MQLQNTRSCPVCGSIEHLVVGPILHPQPTLVAGVPLDLGRQDYTFCRCKRCGFYFKDPEIDQEKLLACYTAAESDNWGVAPDPLQRRFDEIRDVLERHAPGRRILDIGCFNGAMLGFFGPTWDRFGIEPSDAAAELAQNRGVQVIARSLEELDQNVEPFDAILAIDVVEHILNPLPFFRAVSDCLKPGGVFALVTGNTDALAWRLQRSMYWYCSLPEHVSFFNRASLERLGQMTGMKCVEFQTTRPRRLPKKRWISDALKSGAYLSGRAVRGLGIQALQRLCVNRRGPSIQSAKDHLICVLQKRKPAE